MINMRKVIRRKTDETYKHYRREIVVELFADTITLRLHGTRKRYCQPVSHVFDYFCRCEALRIAREKASKRKNRRK